MRMIKWLSIASLVLLVGQSAAAQNAPTRPEGPEGTVTLSLTEYNRLVDLASRPARPPDVAPVAAVLSRASLRVRVDGNAARGVFDLEGQVLRAGTARVRLISGATICRPARRLSPWKWPAQGADGTRVPLLRPGFRPNGPYPVSFVYVHAGTPFARKGDMQMTLPRMDIPVGVVEWELFVPDRYSASRFDGNVIAAHLIYEAAVVGGMQETVTVAAEAPVIDPRSSARSAKIKTRDDIVKGKAGAGGGTAQAEPSQNVVNLQRRAAGVLPVRIEVPRAGTSHRFVKPLVVDQETVVSFRYKRR